jgi:hypothetical protein
LFLVKDIRFVQLAAILPQIEFGDMLSLRQAASDGIKVRISKLDVYGRADRAAYGDPIHQAIHSSVDVESVMEVIRTVTR